MRVLVAPSQGRSTHLQWQVRKTLSYLAVKTTIEKVGIIERMGAALGAVTWCKDNDVELVRAGLKRRNGATAYTEAMLTMVTQFRPDIVIGIRVSPAGQRLVDLCARAGVPALLADYRRGPQRLTNNAVVWRYEDPRLSQGNGSLDLSRGVTLPSRTASS